MFLLNNGNVFAKNLPSVNKQFKSHENFLLPIKKITKLFNNQPGNLHIRVKKNITDT